MPGAPRFDARALVADIQATVARRRAAGEYPEELLQSLRAEFRVAPREESLAALAYIDTHQPPLNRRPVVGRGIVVAQKVLRRSIAWYVQPVAQQQTRFNRAAAVEMRALQERLARLEAPWHRDGSPASAELGAPGRTAGLMRGLEGAAAGQVLVIEVDASAAGERLRQAVTRSDLLLELVRGDPLQLLAERESATLSAVVLPAVLPALSAADLVEVCAAVARRLPPGGRLVLDCPDPMAAELSNRDPSSIDPGMVRWVHRATASVLCEAAGFEQVSVHDVEGGWYGVIATQRG